MPNLKAKEYKKFEDKNMFGKMEASIGVQGNSLMCVIILSGGTFKRSLIEQ